MKPILLEELIAGVALVTLLSQVSAAPSRRTAREACPTPGTNSYKNQDIDRDVCCFDILCDRGEEPVPCDDRRSFRPTCRQCPEGTFQPSRRSLSDRTYYKCRMKTHCDQYQDKGTSFTDATCSCPLDQVYSSDGICLPRPFCRPGYGQTASGGCQRCKEGESYSDEDSNTAPCKAVTKCESLSRCTLKRATVISDSVCGNITYDLRLCDIKVSTQVPTKSHENPTSQPPSKRYDKSSPDPFGAAIGGSLGGAVLLLLAFLAWLLLRRQRRRKKRSHKNLEDKHSRIAGLITDMSSADDVERLRLEVFEIVKNFLAQKYPDRWEHLGEILLAEAFNGIRATLKANSTTEPEKMYEMLEEWRSRCRTTGPDLASLFKAMYSPNNRKTLKLGAVFDEIVRIYGTTIGITDDMTLTPSVQSRNSTVPRPSMSRLSCVDCSDGDNSAIGSLQGLLSGESHAVTKTPRGSTEVSENDASQSQTSVLFEEDNDVPSVLCDNQLPDSKELYESNV